MQFNQVNQNQGDVNNSISSTAVEQAVRIPAEHEDRSWWNSAVAWIGIIGSVASVLGVWLFGWQQWGWWFFGL